MAHGLSDKTLPDPESLNCTWQGVARSNTANLTAALRSQTRGGGENNEISRLRCLTLKMTSYLFPLSFYHFSTSLRIKLLRGVSGLRTQSQRQMFPENRAEEAKQRETGVQCCTRNLPEHQSEFIAQSFKHDTCNMGARLIFENDKEGQEAKEQERRGLLCLESLFHGKPLSSMLFRSILSSLSLLNPRLGVLIGDLWSTRWAQGRETPSMSAATCHCTLLSNPVGGSCSVINSQCSCELESNAVQLRDRRRGERCRQRLTTACLGRLI